MIAKFKNKSFLGFFSMATICIIAVALLILELQFKKSDADINSVPLENLIYMKLKDGVVVIQTFPDVAPKTVARIKELTRQNFYNDNLFFRVIDSFVAQTGDPTGTGRSGTGTNLKAEFSNISHKRGIVSMARANDIHSADSQFFIVLQDSEFLDGKYTVWGKVISGMEFVDEIKKSKTGSSGIVSNPDKIFSMALASDVEKGMKKKIKNKK